MKKIILITALLSLSVVLTSCTKVEKLPAPVDSVEIAKNLISGKHWKVTDVATISGSRKSRFDDNESKKEPVVAPAVELLNWLSNKSEKANSEEFISSYYDKALKISIDLNEDSIAVTEGLQGQEQIYAIIKDSEESKSSSLKLTLTGEDKEFAAMGGGKFTSTYYILGANENKLYLLTPNRLNDFKVVYLLESKAK